MSTEHVEQPRKRNPLQGLNSWVLAIGVASLALTILGVVLTFLALKQPEPGVTFETISDTNVLDLRRSLQDLNIVFRGQDVQEQNLNLRVVTINVVNSGEVDILPSHYDHEDDWGIRFENGEVIEARLVDANSDYLLSKINPESVDVDTVAFPKVIFEEGASFVIEVLLLHSKNDTPSISSVGKIAGIDRITVLTRPLAIQETSFLAQVFQGGALVQIVRTTAYPFGTLVLIVLSMVPIVLVVELVDKVSSSRRKDRVMKTRTIRELEEEQTREFLISHYESRGASGLKELQEMIGEPDKMVWVRPLGRWLIRDYDQQEDRAATRTPLYMEDKFFGSPHTLSTLMKMGVLDRGEDDGSIVDPAFVEALRSLSTELENNAS